MTIRERLHRTWTVVGELTSQLCTFIPQPPERTGIQPEDTARFGILLSTTNNIREHG
ncbi:hypothetical protein [Nocardia miyunensis]|uniref:hypothetical protein n=1 Tax=Nocardia miyunensis TaxID=282684 RepID=UPI000B2C6767|nr:hypothetical protein [Nocardia miyunensis]